MKVVSTINRAVIAAGTIIGVAALATAAAIGVGGFPPARAEAAALIPEATISISADVPAGIAATSAAHQATSGLAAISDRAETRAKAQSRLALERRVVATSLKSPKTRTAARKHIVQSVSGHAAIRRAVRSAPQHPAVRRTVRPRAVVSTRGWSSARVSWYGPGFYGHTMAGGGQLQTNSMIVAHRSLRFGTRIRFSYKGRMVTAVVRDRGPFISGRTFDLGPGTAKALHFSGVGSVKYKIL